MSIESEINSLKEEIRTISNQFSAMNKYYADAVTKTLITKEDLEIILNHIKLIKEMEEKNANIKKSRRINKRTSKKTKRK